ncbi:ABC transporter substrate-binding protein [Nocardioides albidus]|uniref:ABC transporter substrate-binding protein n=1 Tax=Nocardioides albidus TaxID=1517589 RepID=A0A5C4VKZ6_9ACTN|nr:ABC transporter substrate-binding protein [Nocardioides albidus]TNM36520.1 ABC transporter substrate-binding protein [Nocardioides albidus]
MNTRPATLLAGLAVVACSALTACGAPDTGGSASTTLYTESTAAPTSFDPARARAGDDFVVDSLLYDTLVARDDDGLVPALATEWTEDSASSYTFTIRDDATCADGTAITPTVVADSLKYFANNDAGDHVFSPLVFGPGKPTITADDAAGTVSIELSEPYAVLPAGLAIPQSGIICPAGLKDPEGLANGTVEGAFSGPYALGETKPGVSYTYELRKGYDAWPEFAEPLTGKPASKLVFSIATDQATAANKLLSGDLQIANLGGENIDRVSKGDFNRVKTIIANVYVMFNERPGHFFADNAEARQAVARAIDRDAYNNVFSAGKADLFNSIVPSSYACALDDESLIEPHDPAAAASVLKGAKIKMVASTAFGDSGKGAEYLQAVLTDAGAKVDLQKVDNATWATETQKPNGDWDITFMGDINAGRIISASLDRVLGTPLEKGGRNIPGVDNAPAAEALKQGLQTADVDAQCEAFETAQRLLLERDDVVPLSGVTWETTSASNVTVRAPGGNLNYRTVRIED